MGVKITFAVQVAPAAMAVPQVEVVLKLAASVPPSEKDTPEIEICPAFCSLNESEDVVPMV